QATQAAQVMEILPDWLLQQIAAKYIQTLEAASHISEREDSETSTPDFPRDTDHLMVPDGGPEFAEETAKSSHPKITTTSLKSKDDFAGFPKTCKNPAQNHPDPDDVKLWDQVCTRARARPARPP